MVPTFAAEDLLGKYKDRKKLIVVVGEGEEAIEGIVEHVKGKAQLEDIPNIVFLRDGEPVRTRTSTLPLDKLALPAVDTIREIAAVGGLIWIEASRGCNHNCAFCSRRTFRGGKGWRPIPLENVFQQIRQLADLGIRRFIFADDDIMGNNKVDHKYGMLRLEAIARGMMEVSEEIGVKLEWECETRIDTVYNSKDTDEQRLERERIWRLVKESGLVNICIGIESGSDGQLERYNKGVTAEESRKGLELLNSIGIDANMLGFIILDPFMDLEELQEDIDFVEKTNIFDKVFNIISVLRAQEGSDYVKRLSAAGLLLDKQDNLVFYDYRFKNKDIEMIANTCSDWLNEIFELFYFMKCDVSSDAISEHRRNISRGFVDRSKQLDFKLLKTLARRLKDVPDMMMGDVAAEVVREMRLERKALLNGLMDELQKGVYGKDSDFVKEEILQWLDSYGKSEGDRLSAENVDEQFLLAKASRQLEGHPVNMRIDLSMVPEDKGQLKENMETLALMIAGQKVHGLNVRYILENDEHGGALELLKDELEDLTVMEGVDIDGLFKEHTVEEAGEGLIEISLKDLEGIKDMKSLEDREYVVALKDEEATPGVSMPNYTAAANIGLSLAALRIARDKAKAPDSQLEYEKMRKKVLDRFRAIYRRNEIINTEKDFSEDELELMVIGGSETKLYLAVLYALPPVARMVIEELNEYHETKQLLLQAA